MATSGTVGQTVINTATLIEHAMRRAGVPTSDMTPEIAQAARNNLYFLLVSLSNLGINLWTIDIYPMGMVQGSKLYYFPVGTIDVLSCNYRTVTLPSGGTATSSAGGTAANAFDQDITTACTQTSADGYISYDYGTDASTGEPNEPRIVSVGIMPYGDRYLSLTWEYSTDGATWVEAYTAPDNVLYEDLKWTYYEIPNAFGAQYFRCRETGGGTLSVRELVFGHTPNEYALGRLNQDMYDGLPDKDQIVPRRPLNYLFDRVRPAPRTWIWPVPNYNFDQLVWRRHRQIQDVGSLTDEIEIPQRWEEAVINELAKRMIIEIPGADLSRLPILEAMANFATVLASGEERDPAPIQVIPGVGVYQQ